jgi:hypothetical protein
MPNKTIEFMKSNGRKIRKRRHSNQQLCSNVSVIVVVVALFLGGALVRIVILRFTVDQSTRKNKASMLEVPSPWDDIDIWLQSTNLKMLLDPHVEATLTQYMEQSCLPYESNKKNALDPAVCRNRKGNGIADRIGVLRPPGLLGNVFQDYVMQFLDKSRDDDANEEDVIFQAHPWNGEPPVFTKILRPVVMPILLEAIDLTLQTTDDDVGGFSPDNVVLDDLIGVLRLLIRWHCRMARVATNTALLSVSLHGLMTHPHEVDRDLTDFFEFANDLSGDKWHAHMDAYAETVFSCVDTATLFLNALRSRTQSTTLSFIDKIRAAVRDETDGDFCTQHANDNSFPITRGIATSSSRVFSLVGGFFDGSTLAACERHPKAKMCGAAAQQ